MLLLLITRCEFFYMQKAGTENPFQLTLPIQEISHVLKRLSK